MFIDDIELSMDVSSDVRDDVNINSFELKQNYPNPFNPSTVISYSIPQNAFVTLKVYNILGNEVSTLVNEQKAAGNYSVTFNASQLSTGIYFYTLQSGNYSETKKLILMK
ncbi:MAG: T9SS C-terminal target domain-containing protein [Ignavibacteriales bacterium]|nr:MAG: T9SS C-terminal target domain-containing protein [Ignavibacteriales bacterium]